MYNSCHCLNFFVPSAPFTQESSSTWRNLWVINSFSFLCKSEVNFICCKRVETKSSYSSVDFLRVFVLRCWICIVVLCGTMVLWFKFCCSENRISAKMQGSNHREFYWYSLNIFASTAAWHSPMDNLQHCIISVLIQINLHFA